MVIHALPGGRRSREIHRESELLICCRGTEGAAKYVVSGHSRTRSPAEVIESHLDYYCLTCCMKDLNSCQVTLYLKWINSSHPCIFPPSPSSRFAPHDSDRLKSRLNSGTDSTLRPPPPHPGPDLPPATIGLPLCPILNLDLLANSLSSTLLHLPSPPLQQHAADPPKAKTPTSSLSLVCGLFLCLDLSLKWDQPCQLHAVPTSHLIWYIFYWKHCLWIMNGSWFCVAKK